MDKLNTAFQQQVNVYTAFEQGIEETKKRLKNDCRDYDAILGGVQAALLHAGIKKTIGQIANTWHNALAIMHEQDFDLDKVVENMEWITGWKDEWVDGYYSSLSHPPDEAHILREAEMLFEVSARNQFQGIRKNSKKWKDLKEKNFEKAITMKRKQLIGETIESYSRWIKDAERHLKDENEKILRALFQIQKCQDIEALNRGESTNTGYTRMNVQRYVEKGLQHISYIERQIESAKEYIKENS